MKNIQARYLEQRSKVAIQRKRKMADYVHQQINDHSPSVIKARHYLLVDYFNSISSKKQKQEEQFDKISRNKQRTIQKLQGLAQRQNARNDEANINAKNSGHIDDNVDKDLAQNEAKREYFGLPSLIGNDSLKYNQSLQSDYANFRPHHTQKDDFMFTKRKKYQSIDYGQTKRKGNKYLKCQGSSNNSSQLHSRNSYDQTFEIVEEMSQMPIKRISQTGRYETKNKFFIDRNFNNSEARGRYEYAKGAKKTMDEGQSSNQRKSLGQHLKISQIPTQVVAVFQRKPKKYNKYNADREDSNMSRCSPWQGNEDFADDEVRFNPY